MNRLVNETGKIVFGLIPEPVAEINYLDFDFKTSLGRSYPRWFRKMLFKQFFFVGVHTPELSAGIAVIDLKYVANAFCYVYDRQQNLFYETKATALPFRAHISPCPERREATFNTGKLRINMAGDGVVASCNNIEVDLCCAYAQTSPLRLCTRTGYRGWSYTQKTAPIPVSGHIRVGGRRYELSPETSLGVTDWTAGYLRRDTFWNWAAGAGILTDGRRFALNLSCGTNETEATENVFWLDDVQIKVPLVKFQYDADELHNRWRIVSSDGRLDLFFTPVTSRTEQINAVVVASRFTQLIGFFEGYVMNDNMEKIDISACPGWAEDHFARW